MLTHLATPMIIAIVLFLILGFIFMIASDMEDKSKGVIFSCIMIATIFSGFIGFRLFDGVKKFDAESVKIEKTVNEEIKKEELNTELVHTLVANELKIPSKALLIEKEEDFYHKTAEDRHFKDRRE